MASLFLIFTVLVVGGVAAAILRYLDGRRRWIALSILLAWVVYTGTLGISGALTGTGGVPRIALILIPTLAGALLLAFSGAGRTVALSIPLSLLIGAQTFRVIVELFIHQLWSVGVMHLPGGEFRHTGRPVRAGRCLVGCAWAAFEQAGARLERARPGAARQYRGAGDPDDTGVAGAHHRSAEPRRGHLSVHV